MIRAARATTRLRRPLAAASTAVAAIALTAGCAQIPASDQTALCKPTDLFPVTVTGEGKGPVVTDNGVANIAFTFTDNTTGQQESNWSPNPKQDGTPGAIKMTTLAPFLQEALRCMQAGETAELTLSNEQMYDPALLAQAGVDPAGTTDWSITVNKVYHSAASGRIAPQQNGIPAVVNAPNGGVGVTMPKDAAPTEQRVAETINGFGAPVADGDSLVVEMSAFAWKTGEQLFSSWAPPANATQAPRPLVVAATEQDNLFGSAHALVGHPVGSQVVVIVPADKLAEYAAATGSQPFGNGDAVVFVYDILGTE